MSDTNPSPNPSPDPPDHTPLTRLIGRLLGRDRELPGVISRAADLVGHGLAVFELRPETCSARMLFLPADPEAAALELSRYSTEDLVAIDAEAADVVGEFVAGALNLLTDADRPAVAARIEAGEVQPRIVCDFLADVIKVNLSPVTDGGRIVPGVTVAEISGAGFADLVPRPTLH